MPIRVTSVEFMDGAVAINWFKDEEQREDYGEYRQTVISADAAAKHQQVAYYMEELHQDVHELIEWWTRRDRN